MVATTNDNGIIVDFPLLQKLPYHSPFTLHWQDVEHYTFRVNSIAYRYNTGYVVFFFKGGKNKMVTVDMRYYKELTKDVRSRLGDDRYVDSFEIGKQLYK